MDITELKQSLEFLYEANASIEIVIYAILKDNENPKKLDIKVDDLPEISNLLVQSIKNKIIDKDDFTVLPLSTADERKNCFYQYDLELPEELKHLETISSNDNIESFNFKNNKIEEMDSLFIVMSVGDTEISIYKKLSSVEVIGRGGYILGKVRLGKAKERFERFKDKLLRISGNFQVIRVNNEVIILDLAMIEKSFGFHDVIKREANLSIDAIDEMKILSDIESLKEMVDNVSFARKLTKIARNSPVIKLKISNENIIAFSKKHPATKNMKYTDNKKFNLTTKKSKDLFIKLLNDDLLTSELTKLHYASLAKDGFENETTEQTTETNND